jgi:hypothetical protein
MDTLYIILQIKFNIPLNTSMDFTKCRKIYVRGYNKAGVWSTVSTEIKKCNIDDGDSLFYHVKIFFNGQTNTILEYKH